MLWLVDTNFLLRLTVPAMNVHGVTRLATFNNQDFKRYRGITVMTPAEVIAPHPPQPAS